MKTIAIIAASVLFSASAFAQAPVDPFTQKYFPENLTEDQKKTLEAERAATNDNGSAAQKTQKEVNLSNDEGVSEPVAAPKPAVREAPATNEGGSLFPADTLGGAQIGGNQANDRASKKAPIDLDSGEDDEVEKPEQPKKQATVDIERGKWLLRTYAGYEGVQKQLVIRDEPDTWGSAVIPVATPFNYETAIQKGKAIGAKAGQNDPLNNILVVYDGVYYASQSGRYSFQLNYKTTAPRSSADIECGSDLEIATLKGAEYNNLASMRVVYAPQGGGNISPALGSANLKKGFFKVRIKAACQVNRFGIKFEDQTFGVLVKGPNDNDFSNLTPKNIGYLKQVEVEDDDSWPTE